MRVPSCTLVSLSPGGPGVSVLSVVAAELDLVPTLICHAERENTVNWICGGWMEGVGSARRKVVNGENTGEHKKKNRENICCN